MGTTFVPALQPYPGTLIPATSQRLPCRICPDHNKDWPYLKLKIYCKKKKKKRKYDNEA